MPRDRSRSPLSRRRRSRSRSRERYRERHDRESDRRRRDRDTYKDGDRYRRDHTPEKRKERRHGHSSDDHRGKELKTGRSWRDSRSRTPDQVENVSNDAAAEGKETKAPQTEGELEMMKTLGFFSFDSTKGKHVRGNNVYVANIQKKRKYRQYMNRRGGFNRKLDPIT